jgi:hypothetical protein
MRIIKRGRRHIVIYPGSAPFGVRERKALESSREPAVVRFDQLPDTLQQVLSTPRSAAADGAAGKPTQ